MLQTTKTGLVFVLIGVLLVLLSLVFAAAGRPLNSFYEELVSIAIEILKHLGVAAILLGIFNLILSRRDWQEYFEARLKSIVVDQSYLGSLDRAALKRMMISVIKAQAPGAAVDREGSFLEYFDRHLHKFIFEPFREDVSAEFSYDDDPSDPAMLHVVDKYSYTLRVVGETLQKSVRYDLEKQECGRAIFVEIHLKLPETAAEPGRIVTLLEKRPFPEINADGKYSVDVPIPGDYLRLDGLEVSVETEYTVSKERFQMWWMLVPTRHLRVIIEYPEKYDIQIKAFVQAPNMCDWTRRPGYVQLKYPTWFLPNNGIAWTFTSRTAGDVKSAVIACGDQPPDAQRQS